MWILLPMATFRSAARVYPDGMVVGAYPATARVDGAAPAAAAVATGTVAAGVLSISGLTPGRPYVLYGVVDGVHRYASFQIGAGQSPAIQGAFSQAFGDGDIPEWDASAGQFVPSDVAGRVVRPNTVMGLGDSITANGWYTTNPCVTFSGQSYMMWLNLLSAGKLRLLVPAGVLGGPIAATSGFTTAQIIATHLPTIIAARPGYCVVLAGANDAPALNVSNANVCIANLVAIYDALRAAGITPILCTLTPRADTTYPYGFAHVNAAIKRYGAQYGLPVADLYSALADPATTSNYLAAYDSGDHIHPNAAGGKLIGQTIWAAVQSNVAAVDPPLAANNTRGASDPADALAAIGNSLFLTDTNADGIPDNWGVASGAGTPSLATAASKGKLLTITRGASDYKLWNLIDTDSPISGHRVIFSAEVNSTVEASGGKAEFMLMDVNNALACGIDQWTTDVPVGSVMSAEFVWPASGYQNESRLRLSAIGAAGARAAWGRMSLIDLTRLGIS